MAKLIIVVMIIILSSGCETNNWSITQLSTEVIIGSEDFSTSEQIDAVATSISDWNEALKKNALTLKIVSGKIVHRTCGKVYVSFSDDLDTNTELGIEYSLHSCMAIIQIKRDEFYYPGILTKVLEHELGHAFGLSHSKDKTSVMFKTLNINDASKQTITKEDVENVNFLLGLFT